MWVRVRASVRWRISPLTVDKQWLAPVSCELSARCRVSRSQPQIPIGYWKRFLRTVQKVSWIRRKPVFTSNSNSPRKSILWENTRRTRPINQKVCRCTLSTDERLPLVYSGATFDVRRSVTISTEDEIRLLQNRCKRLLADTKEKMFVHSFSLRLRPTLLLFRDSLEKGLERDKPHVKLTKLWFYGDNQHIRTRTNLLTLNEAASLFNCNWQDARCSWCFSEREKTKFVFAVLRGQVPDKYQINVDIPPNKRKFLLEFDDGSGQI